MNLETYSRVIRLWVKDIRDRSSQQSLEVSLISSDSEVRGPILHDVVASGVNLCRKKRKMEKKMKMAVICPAGHSCRMVSYVGV